MKRKVIIIVGLLLLIGVAATWVALKGRQASSGTASAENTSGAKAKRAGLQRSGALAGDGTEDGSTQTTVRTSGVKRAAHRVTALDLVDDPKLPDADKQTVIDLQDALDENDLSGVAKAARKLRNSTSVPARVRAVTALSWFGAAALPEIVEMLGDPSEDVAEAAIAATLEAIDEMDDDDPRKAALLTEFITQLNDMEALEDALMLFVGMEDEIAIQSLDTLIARSQGDPAKLAALINFLNFIKGDSFL